MLLSTPTGEMIPSTTQLSHPSDHILVALRGATAWPSLIKVASPGHFFIFAVTFMTWRPLKRSLRGLSCTKAGQRLSIAGSLGIHGTYVTAAHAFNTWAGGSMLSGQAFGQKGSGD